MFETIEDTSPRIPERPPSPPSGAVQRRQRGSVVTYVVAAFMLVALLVYLGAAYFADEPGSASTGAEVIEGAE